MTTDEKKTLSPSECWPDAEAVGQRQSEDESSQDTQHRSRPADEESSSQFKPVCQRWWGIVPLIILLFGGFFFYSDNLLLSNEEWVEEVCRDSVSVNGTRSHATQAWKQKWWSNYRIWNLKFCLLANQSPACGKPSKFPAQNSVHDCVSSESYYKAQRVWGHILQTMSALVYGCPTLSAATLTQAVNSGLKW